MDHDLINSPLERSIARDGVTVQICIYRSAEDPGWLLEIVDHLGGSTVWDDFFPTDQEALDEALQAIETEGIRSFADATEQR